MAHANARLTVYSRQALVERVLVEGWPASEVARHFQVSRSTAYKWVRRYRAEGETGLVESEFAAPPPAARPASRRGRRDPRRAAPSPLRPAPPGAAYRAPSLDDLRCPPPPPGQPPRRPRPTDRSSRPTAVRRTLPGSARPRGRQALVRVPGPPTRRTQAHPGHDQLEVFVDDHSRLACVVVTRNGGAGETVQALDRAVRWFAAQGITIERILTDNGSSYCSNLYEARLHELGIRHSRTRVRRPQTNGKAERFIGRS